MPPRKQVHTLKRLTHTHTHRHPQEKKTTLLAWWLHFLHWLLFTDLTVGGYLFSNHTILFIDSSIFNWLPNLVETIIVSTMELKLLRLKFSEVGEMWDCINPTNYSITLTLSRLLVIKIKSRKTMINTFLRMVNIGKLLNLVCIIAFSCIIFS